MRSKEEMGTEITNFIRQSRVIPAVTNTDENVDEYGRNHNGVNQRDLSA